MKPKAQKGSLFNQRSHHLHTHTLQDCPYTIHMKVLSCSFWKGKLVYVIEVLLLKKNGVVYKQV